MKLLLISNTVMHYRVPVYNYFYQQFSRFGWQFAVLTNQIQPENPHTPTFPLTEMPFNFVRYVRTVQSTSPDVVILFLHLKDRILWPLAHWLKARRIPIAFWTKGRNLDRPNDRFRALLYTYMHTISDAIILYSEYERSLINSWNQSKTFVANNTLNFYDFPHISQPKESIRRELGIPFQKVVLSAGRMDVAGGRKRIHELVKAFAAVRDPRFGLVIVGSGMGPSIKKEMNRSNTMYLGEIYDSRHVQISKIFKAADVFSVPGHIGLSINQAFYWGLPVVTCDGPHPPEIHYLIDGRNGFIVPQGDLSALIDKTLLLLTDEDLRARFSKNARSDILKNASIERMFDGFLSSVRFLRTASQRARQ